jgi:hypothetical protein
MENMLACQNIFVDFVTKDIVFKTEIGFYFCNLKDITFREEYFIFRVDSFIDLCHRLYEYKNKKEDKVKNSFVVENVIFTVQIYKTTQEHLNVEIYGHIQNKLGRDFFECLNFDVKKYEKSNCGFTRETTVENFDPQLYVQKIRLCQEIKNEFEKKIARKNFSRKSVLDFFYFLCRSKYTLLDIHDFILKKVYDQSNDILKIYVLYEKQEVPKVPLFPKGKQDQVSQTSIGYQKTIPPKNYAQPNILILQIYILSITALYSCEFHQTREKNFFKVKILCHKNENLKNQHIKKDNSLDQQVVSQTIPGKNHIPPNHETPARLSENEPKGKNDGPSLKQQTMEQIYDYKNMNHIFDNPYFQISSHYIKDPTKFKKCLEHIKEFSLPYIFCLVQMTKQQD